MPFVRVLLVLVCGLMLSGYAAYAQRGTSPQPTITKTPPQRQQRVLTIHLPLPTLVARLGEAAGLLERSTPKNRRSATDQPVPDDPVLILTLPLPKLFSTKPAAVPATP